MYGKSLKANLSKKCSCCQNQLDLCKICRISKNINITLIELSENDPSADGQLSITGPICNAS